MQPKIKSDQLDVNIAATNDNASPIVIGAPVYVSSNGSVNLAKADAAATSNVFGLVADTSIANAASGNIVTSGVFVATTAQWDTITGGAGGLTFNTKYYLSDTTAGKLTTIAPTAPGTYVAPVGIALSTTQLNINID